MPDKKVTYKLTETCLGNPLDLEVSTEKFCIYCKHLSQPDFGDPDYPKGFAGCSRKAEVSLDDSCERWEPNTKVRYWLSKGCMEYNIDGWPRKPWYQVFDDGPDGEKGTR